MVETEPVQRAVVVVAPLLAGGRRGRWANRSGGPRAAQESPPPERTKRERAAGAHRYGEEVCLNPLHCIPELHIIDQKCPSHPETQRCWMAE